MLEHIEGSFLLIRNMHDDIDHGPSKTSIRLRNKDAVSPAGSHSVLRQTNRSEAWDIHLKSVASCSVLCENRRMARLTRTLWIFLDFSFTLFQTCESKTNGVLVS